MVLLLEQLFPEELQLQDHLGEPTFFLNDALGAEDPMKGRCTVLLNLSFRVL